MPFTSLSFTGDLHSSFLLTSCAHYLVGGEHVTHISAVLRHEMLNQVLFRACPGLLDTSQASFQPLDGRNCVVDAGHVRVIDTLMPQRDSFPEDSDILVLHPNSHYGGDIRRSFLWLYLSLFDSRQDR